MASLTRLRIIKHEAVLLCGSFEVRFPDVTVYPDIYEMGRAYPGDPNVVPLLSAAEKLVEGLYLPCRAAA